ncbi:MAG: endonuclease III [Armatimonas sp.]
MSADVAFSKKQDVTPQEVRQVMETLAATYHGRGSVEMGDPFKVLVATVISQRTREEQTTKVSERVFAHYPDASTLAKTDQAELYDLLSGSEYRETKAPRLIEMAKQLVEKFEGQVPQNIEDMLTLPGVGRKTANCVLIYAFNRAALCVDIHMHRITNRLGWVNTKTPEATERALEKIMPEDLWAGSNRLFLQHGRALCRNTAPKCNRCPVRAHCAYGTAQALPMHEDYKTGE